MSKRLRDALARVRVKKGRPGLRELARSLDVTLKTIERWEEKGVPDEHKAYQLALACGCSEEEALAIGMECSSVKVEETA